MRCLEKSKSSYTWLNWYVLGDTIEEGDTRMKLNFKLNFFVAEFTKNTGQTTLAERVGVMRRQLKTGRLFHRIMTIKEVVVF